MFSDLGRLGEVVERLSHRLSLQPVFGWAVVTSLSPLRIKYDGDDAEIAGTPDRLVSGLTVGERVWCQRQFRRDLILGRAGRKAARVLWSGSWYMHGTQEAALSERISDQDTGIVLVWQAYKDGAVQNYDVVHTFISKTHVEASDGFGMQCTIWPGNNADAPFLKYVYVSDAGVRGHANNIVSPRNSHVLVRVVGI